MGLKGSKKKGRVAYSKGVDNVGGPPSGGLIAGRACPGMQSAGACPGMLLAGGRRSYPPLIFSRQSRAFWITPTASSVVSSRFCNSCLPATQTSVTWLRLAA